jgi:hypothetical protein
VVSLAGWAYLTASSPKNDSAERPTHFFSQIVNREINYASNHKIYTILTLTLVLSCVEALIELSVSSFTTAIYYWILLAITLVFTVNLATISYGIATNTSPN